jgi:proteasome lid subunit RPN8/RPN11
MHILDKHCYKRLLQKARNSSRQVAGSEICGLIIDTGSQLRLVETRNASRRLGSFTLSTPDVRRIASAVKVLGEEIVGTFHSHPVSEAKPGASDIAHALDDSLMFIFDCVGNTGRLWKIKSGKARPLRYTLSTKPTEA